MAPRPRPKVLWPLIAVIAVVLLASVAVVASVVGSGDSVRAGESCGTIASDLPATGGELAVRVGVERGEIDCEELFGVVREYVTSPELCDGITNTCVATVSGWRCSIPTAGSFPVSLNCEDTDTGARAIGLDAQALQPSERLSCPATEEDAPVDIIANFDCQAAQGLARTLGFAPCTDQRCVGSGFVCRTEPSGFDTRTDYECRFEGAQLEFRSDPEA